MDNFVKRFLLFLNFCIRKLFVLFLASYRTIGSGWLGGACRFEPSCSAYIFEAFQTLPLQTAFKLSLRRLLQCRPGGKFGYDPLPSLPVQPAFAQQLCRGHNHG